MVIQEVISTKIYIVPVIENIKYKNCYVYKSTPETDNTDEVVLNDFMKWSSMLSVAFTQSTGEAARAGTSRSQQTNHNINNNKKIIPLLSLLVHGSPCAPTVNARKSICTAIYKRQAKDIPLD